MVADRDGMGSEEDRPAGRSDERLTEAGPRHRWATRILGGIALLAYGGITGTLGLLVHSPELVERVWAAQPVVDGFFLLGMATVGYAAYHLTQEWSWIHGLGAGLLGTWTVMLLSAVLLMAWPGSEFHGLWEEPGVLAALSIVTVLAVPGIVLGGALPTIAAKLKRGSDGSGI